MIILGIDPGTRLTGIGIIEVKDRTRVLAADVIRLNEKLNLEHRLAELHRQLAEVFQKFQPHITVVEKIFYGKNIDSAFKLGHARGVCLMAAAANQSQVAEYAAKFVKKAITGSGAATKEHVGLIVMRLLRYTPPSSELDITDALALALCHAHSIEVKLQTARAMTT
jgi:crossover junction endodeoxyribonuclease RuvC